MIYFCSQSLISKKRVALKNGNELPENDQAELQRITEEQSGLQKHLDAARKANRQHNAVVQVSFFTHSYNFLVV